MIIRPVEPQDHTAIQAIIVPTIRTGTTYTLETDLSEAGAMAYWLASDKETFVADVDGEIVGTYYIRANQAGGGKHVCNCGFMTNAQSVGKGVARAMCVHSLNQARTRGFRAMQFNFVVSTNIRAVKLWQAMGFEIVGRLPSAFQMPNGAYVDALVFYQHL
jgi:ribosomal protein S18 acetylase RimI-like enzyme